MIIIQTTIIEEELSIHFNISLSTNQILQFTFDIQWNPGAKRIKRSISCMLSVASIDVKITIHQTLVLDDSGVGHPFAAQISFM